MIKIATAFPIDAEKETFPDNPAGRSTRQYVSFTTEGLIATPSMTTAKPGTAKRVPFKVMIPPMGTSTEGLTEVTVGLEEYEKSEFDVPRPNLRTTPNPALLVMHEIEVPGVTTTRLEHGEPPTSIVKFHITKLLPVKVI